MIYNPFSTLYKFKSIQKRHKIQSQICFVHFPRYFFSFWLIKQEIKKNHRKVVIWSDKFGHEKKKIGLQDSGNLGWEYCLWDIGVSGLRVQKNGLRDWYFILCIFLVCIGHPRSARAGRLCAGNNGRGGAHAISQLRLFGINYLASRTTEPGLSALVT